MFNFDITLAEPLPMSMPGQIVLTNWSLGFDGFWAGLPREQFDPNHHAKAKSKHALQGWLAAQMVDNFNKQHEKQKAKSKKDMGRT